MGLTTNLFFGRGETDHDLAVIEGHWPDDCDGAVVVVGPDKRAPGGSLVRGTRAALSHRPGPARRWTHPRASPAGPDVARSDP